MIEWDPDISRSELLSILDAEGTVWLDEKGNSAKANGAEGDRGEGGHTGNGATIFANPVETITAMTLHEVESAFLKLDDRLQSGFFVAGYVSYEAGYAFERKSFMSFADASFKSEVGYPLLWFGVYKEPIRVRGFRWPNKKVSISLEPEENELEFAHSVEKIRSLIEEGDVYQINHTTRFASRMSESGKDLYGELRSRQPVRYGAYLRIPGAEVLSFSPELFFRVSNGFIEASPMKGTSPRGATPDLDIKLKDWLSSDVKNRAENLMIVDLLRNDLSMVCEPGSVVVPRRFEIETHPTVHQMTSTVQGKLNASTGLHALFSSLFPCGSITGAPKIRAMKRISELEKSFRGLYCGAIGFASPSGHHVGKTHISTSQTGSANRSSGMSDAVFSVAIRTATLSDQILTYGAGGGIVWDSDPHSEYAEAMLKTRFLSDAEDGPFYLFETMLWDGSVRWLQLHLDRLESSAQQLGIPMERAAVEAAVLQEGAVLQKASEKKGNSSFRIKLMVTQDGTLKFESKTYSKPIGPLKIGSTSIRVSSTHPLLRHKTSERLVYERAQVEAKLRSLFDVLLINEKEEVTEGSISNIFARIDGKWATPPLSSGILPGVGRRIFLLENGAEERPISIHDLEKADELRVTNALIGSLRATWVPSE